MIEISRRGPLEVPAHLQEDIFVLTLIYNGDIRTMDRRQPRAQAALIENGRFAFVGSLRAARAELTRRGESAREIDLEGRLTLPGFNDSHMHFLHFAKGLMSVDLSGTQSIAEIQERMKAGLEQGLAPEGTWLEGEGWNQDYFTQGEKRFPNRADLDAVCPDKPMMIMRACFHIGALNSAALQALHITRETVADYGGLAGVGPDGEPDGIIKESLLDDTKAQISSLNLETMKRLILAAQQKALAQGITSIQSDDVGYTPQADYNLLFEAFAQLEAEGKLCIRLSEQCLLQKPELIEEFWTPDTANGAPAGSGPAASSCWPTAAWAPAPPPCASPIKTTPPQRAWRCLPRSG